MNNSTSTSTENGTWNGNANSTSFGDTTNTNANGGYSGTRQTSTYGSSQAVYKIYDNLVIEGADTVYVTSERLRWRWSHGTHAAVYDTIKYDVDGRKLHVLDEDNKEHTIEIVKEIRKRAPGVTPVAPRPAEGLSQVAPAAAIAPAAQASVTIDSTPAGADIEIDGAFVGNTPSSLAVASGRHVIVVSKPGFTSWSRTLNVTGGAVHVAAELVPEPAKQ